MSELFLIRHGQASFASDNYDQLSEVGHEQVRILADYWRALDLQLDCIYSGSLVRQMETAQGLADCISAREPTVLAGLNEYSSHEILAAFAEQHASKDGFGAGGDMKDRKFFQRYLEQACHRWVRGELEGHGLELFAHFKERVSDALMTIMSANAKSKKVAVATSGGVIALIVQSVLKMPDDAAISLNWMVYNSSVTRIQFSGSRSSLSSFNGIPHLERPGFTDKITYR